MNERETPFREVQRLSQWWLKLLMVLLGLVPPLLLASHLDTRVEDGVLHVRFWPFHLERRSYLIAELVSFERRAYSPLREYGGWGLRSGRRGDALTVSGSEGVELSFRRRRPLMIGSQRASELEAALRNAGRGPEFHERQYLWQGSGALFVALGALPVLIAVALFFSLRMTTEVRTDGVYVRFAPFHRKFRRFGFDELASFEVRSYRPLREYGGWGLRGFGRNRALNVSGNRGLQLVFEDGRRVLIGSQQPEKLAAAMRAQLAAGL